MRTPAAGVHGIAAGESTPHVGIAAGPESSGFWAKDLKDPLMINAHGGEMWTLFPPELFDGAGHALSHIC